MKKLVCCVTNDLSTDQRMARICGSLSAEGWDVSLVGRQMPNSKPLSPKPYRQVRLNMIFSKGKLFYLEYQIRLLCYLLFQKMDAVVAIDLDTIIPCYYASKWKKVPRVYDAHELFTELKEVVTRPSVQKAWLWVERTYVPRFTWGYTVSASILREFEKRYGVRYLLVRNLPLLQPMQPVTEKTEKFLLYQGAVNEGRGLEWLIPAMAMVDAPLLIYGEGNFSEQCRSLIRQHGLEHKVKMMGVADPGELRRISSRAYAGINLVEPIGLNQIYSLANKFFDYIHAGIPQLTMDLPEYRSVNEDFEVAVLISRLEPEIIGAALNKLLDNEVFYAYLQNNCVRAAEVLNWQVEERTLIDLYHKILD